MADSLPDRVTGLGDWFDGSGSTCRVISHAFAVRLDTLSCEIWSRLRLSSERGFSRFTDGLGKGLTVHSLRRPSEKLSFLAVVAAIPIRYLKLFLFLAEV